MGGMRETFMAIALASFALLPHQTFAAELQPFDASGCEDDGSWVVCPQVAPKPLILSHEQFEALKSAAPLSATQFDQALKTYHSK